MRVEAMETDDDCDEKKGRRKERKGGGGGGGMKVRKENLCVDSLRTKTPKRLQTDRQTSLRWKATLVTIVGYNRGERHTHTQAQMEQTSEIDGESENRSRGGEEVAKSWTNQFW